MNLDSARLGQSLQTLSATFSGTPPAVRKALDGVTGLAKVISSRDTELKRLLAGANRFSGTSGCACTRVGSSTSGSIPRSKISSKDGWNEACPSTPRQMWFHANAGR